MDSEPSLPIPISYIGSKYLIFDIKAVTWLRRTHHICGIMGGTLPQSPSQNIFLGLPLQIMPEEAQLLVERRVCCIVDDAKSHEQAMNENDSARQDMYIGELVQRGLRFSIARNEEKEEIRRIKHSKSKGKARKQPSASSDEPQPDNINLSNPSSSSLSTDIPNSLESETNQFDSTSTIKPSHDQPPSHLEPHNIVPTTSVHWLPTPPQTPTSIASNKPLLHNVSPSYHLYKHLNSRSYFMTPGLRFGCQYCVYPGDPLRFHSHFLAVGTQWDEEIDLMNIVGGGRLGTGVKKGFLIGGLEPNGKQGLEGENEEREGRVRTFSIEWAAM